jgi:hypothetical protein
MGESRVEKQMKQILLKSFFPKNKQSERLFEKLFSLAFAELEPSASALLAVLLALLAARVAGYEAFRLEGLAKLGVEEHESAGDAELHGVGLTHDTATLYGRDDVEGLFDAGDAERPLGGGALLSGDEVYVTLFLVDGELAAAGAEEYAGDGRLAPAGSVVLD